jgi:histone acetyltransferase (RNA polymerase elongator complex component)
MTPKRRIIPVFVPHLGCPNACVFCNQRKISGELRHVEPRDVRRAIEEGLLKNKTSREMELAFYGGSFTAIPDLEQEKLLGAAGPFLRSGQISSIRISTRPDCINDDILKRLIRYGVGTVELGVQSMADDVLIASNRGHTAADAVKAAHMIKSEGLKLILQMMTGLPCDTPEKSEYTARRLAQLSPHGVRIYPTVIIRDTPLYDMWRAGTYKEHTIEEAARLCVKLLNIFDEYDIPVIRLGLNPTDELSEGAAAAGAYHPAFGEIVASERYLEVARAVLSKAVLDGRVTLLIAHGQTSAMTGQKRRNIEILKSEFGIRSLKVREAEMEKGKVAVIIDC